MLLQDLTDDLLRDPLVADKLKLADDYILQRRRFGSRFILPREHTALKPIIDQYSKNLTKFVEYVKSVRDSVPARSNSYIALHELYRTLEVRLVQQARRERAGRALDWVEKKHPKLTYEQKIRWLRKLEQQWGKRRMAMMEEARRRTHSGRLNTVEREGLLEEFWTDIDREITKGDLPAP